MNFLLDQHHRHHFAQPPSQEDADPFALYDWSAPTVGITPAEVFPPQPPEEEEDEQHTSSINDQLHSTNQDEESVDGGDVKDESAKQRRQARNKISARNFRLRRKEYISSLEEQVASEKSENKLLKQKLTAANEKNTELTQEVNMLQEKLRAVALAAPKKKYRVPITNPKSIDLIKETNIRKRNLDKIVRSFQEHETVSSSYIMAKEEMSFTTASQISSVSAAESMSLPQTSSIPRNSTDSNVPDRLVTGSPPLKSKYLSKLTVHSAVLVQ